jgi:hypothetical protein
MNQHEKVDCLQMGDYLIQNKIMKEEGDVASVQSE